MKKFISIVLCIVLFFLINISLVTFCVSRLASSNFVTKVIDDVEVKDVIDSIRESDNAQVSQAIDDVYEKASEHGFSEEQVNNILESDMTKEVLEKYSSNLLENGRGLTEEDINEIASNNVDEIIDNSNGRLKEEDRSEIIRAAETMAPTIASKLPDADKISEMTGNKVDFKVEKNKGGNYGFWIYLLATFLVLGIIIVIQRKKFKWLLYTGVTVLVSSICALLFTFLGCGLLNLIIGEEKLVKNVLSPVISNFSLIAYITLGICLVISIGELIAYNILKNKNKKSVA